MHKLQTTQEETKELYINATFKHFNRSYWQRKPLAILKKPQFPPSETLVEGTYILDLH